VRVDVLTKEYPPEIYGGAGVHVAELVRALPDGRLVTIDAGHLVHDSRPDEFTHHLLTFLDA